MNAILEKLWNETVRMEKMIFLAGALAAGDSLPDDVRDFFDDEDPETIEKCFGEVPDWVELDARPQDRDESIYEWLSGENKLGFLVKFATPVMKPTGHSSRSYSWGRYTTTWVYAQSVDEAIDKAIVWSGECRAREDAKAAAQAGAV